jgi:hypothetical protein
MAFMWFEEFRVQLQLNHTDVQGAIKKFPLLRLTPLLGSKKMSNREGIGTPFVGTKEMTENHEY